MKTTTAEKLTLPLGERVALPEGFNDYKTLALLAVSNGNARLELVGERGRFEFWLEPSSAPRPIGEVKMTFLKRYFDGVTKITVELTT
jgi:hypothetical protein